MLARKVRLQNAITIQDERGAAMAEYGLLLLFVALAVIGILTMFGETLADTFGFAAEAIDNANSTTPATPTP